MAVVLAASPESGLCRPAAGVWIATAGYISFSSKGHKGSYADI